MGLFPADDERVVPVEPELLALVGSGDHPQNDAHQRLRGDPEPTRSVITHGFPILTSDPVKGKPHDYMEVTGEHRSACRLARRLK